MSSRCCGTELQVVEARQRRVLTIVLAVNVLMFAVEFAGGVRSRSSALLADSLDMLGDSFVYGVSLYALGRGLEWKRRAALSKGVVMGLFGLGILIDAASKAVHSVVPVAVVMGAVGLAALAANAGCAALLWRHRRDDANMRSVWLCSRNDVIQNLGTLAAAAVVAWTGSLWPDLIVGAATAALCLHSSVLVLRENRQKGP